jgi:hypothetical protein
MEYIVLGVALLLLAVIVKIQYTRAHADLRSQMLGEDDDDLM